MDLNSREITGNQDINSFLDFTLAGMAKMLQADWGVILRLKYRLPVLNLHPSPSGHEAEVEVVAQWTSQAKKPKSLLNFSFQFSQSKLCQQAFFVSPQAVVVNNKEDLLAITDLEDITNVFKLKNRSSLLMAPLINHQSSENSSPLVLGFIVVQNKEPRYWQAHEIEMIKWSGVQAAVTIINNQTLQQVQSLVDSRTSQLKFSLDVQRKLYSKRQQDLEEMQRLSEAKDTFIDNLSDALRHPLAKMRMAIEMLKMNPSREKTLSYIEIIETQYQEEKKLINDLLTFKQLKSSELKPDSQKFYLRDIINELAADFKNKWINKGLCLRINGQENIDSNSQISLYSDPDSIKFILNELLSNAGKFADQNTVVDLEVGEQKKSGETHVFMRVTDFGKGISSEEKERIFEQFRRGNNVSMASGQGTGLGLSLVKSLVEYFDGTIEVSSEAQKKSSQWLTSFTIILPKRPILQQ